MVLGGSSLSRTVGRLLILLRLNWCGVHILRAPVKLRGRQDLNQYQPTHSDSRLFDKSLHLLTSTPSRSWQAASFQLYDAFYFSNHRHKSNSTMLCEVCFFMLRGQEGRIWQGTNDLRFNHHQSIKNLRVSAEMRCGICRVLFEEFCSYLCLATEELDDYPITTTAILSVPKHSEKPLYRLDFKLECARVRCQRTFVLQETSKIEQSVALGRGLRNLERSNRSSITNNIISRNLV
jgi:hypothetical protein